MANQPDTKSLEMRIAALEDKLSKMNVTEEEMRAYEKVSGLMGGGAQFQPDPDNPYVCQISRIPRYIPIYRGGPRIVRFPNECSCGPCAEMGGGGFSGGGFGNFGM